TADPAPQNGRPTWDDRVGRASAGRHVAPEQAGRLRADAPAQWMDSASQLDPAGGFADATAASQHSSGLPIRQPQSVTRPPRSPSGSLWERAEQTPDGSPAETTDTRWAADLRRGSGRA